MIAKERTIQKSAPRAQIAHVHERGLHATIVRREILREFHVTVEALPDDSAESIVQRLHAFMRVNSASIVRLEAFGSRDALEKLVDVQTNCFEHVNWPVSCVKAFSCEKSPLAGIHAFAVSGAQIELLYDGDRVVGTTFSDGLARHCLLGDIISRPATPGREKRTFEAFHKIAGHLRSAGMDLTHVARTWLFLDDILSWYGLFNKERREVFEAYRIFDHCVPASTGIGAANIRNAALLAGAWALQPLDNSTIVRPVESPLQCSARDYGSCFSRAVEILSPDLRRLFISGTASIAPDGRTEYVGDVRRQVARTMEVVEAILTSRGMRWEETSRATVYLRNGEDAWAFCEFAEEHDLALPAIVTEATVCRDDLLFEIEIDALATGRRRSARDWEI